MSGAGSVAAFGSAPFCMGGGKGWIERVAEAEPEIRFGAGRGAAGKERVAWIAGKRMKR